MINDIAKVQVTNILLNTWDNKPSENNKIE